MPPEHEHDIEEMDTSSVSSVQDEAEPVQTGELSATSESSTETDVSNTVADDDALSVVREVVAKRDTSEAAASSAKGEEVAGSEAGDRTQETVDDETYKDVPFNKHPRFQKVLGELKSAKVDAEHYRNVQAFIDQQGLAAEEAAEMLTIGGLIKTNPAEAWRRMKPTVEAVLRAAGEVLPDDLAQRVQQGELTPDAALEVSRSRATIASVQAGQTFAQQRAERTRQEEAARAAEQATLGMMSTAQDWEDDRRTKDPNFESKLPAILDEVKRLQTFGWKPTSQDGVKEQLDRAYRAVNARLQPRTIQQKPAVAPVRGGQVNGAVQPQARSTLDIINRVVAQRGAGAH